MLDPVQSSLHWLGWGDFGSDWCIAPAVWIVYCQGPGQRLLLPAPPKARIRCLHTCLDNVAQRIPLKDLGSIRDLLKIWSLPEQDQSHHISDPGFNCYYNILTMELKGTEPTHATEAAYETCFSLPTSCYSFQRHLFLDLQIEIML